MHRKHKLIYWIELSPDDELRLQVTVDNRVQLILIQAASVCQQTLLLLIEIESSHGLLNSRSIDNSKGWEEDRGWRGMISKCIAGSCTSSKRDPSDQHKTQFKSLLPYMICTAGALERPQRPAQLCVAAAETGTRVVTFVKLPIDGVRRRRWLKSLDQRETQYRHQLQQDIHEGSLLACVCRRNPNVNDFCWLSHPSFAILHQDRLLGINFAYLTLLHPAQITIRLDLREMFTSALGSRGSIECITIFCYNKLRIFPHATQLSCPVGISEAPLLDFFRLLR